MSHPRRVVLAFAGDAHSARAIPRLADRASADVVTVTLDLGQGVDLEQVREQAIAAGAVRAHVVDARERFANEVLLPSLRAGAADPAITTPGSLARSTVAAVLVEIARMENAASAAHGATGQARAALERLISESGPDLAVVALEDVGLCGSEDAQKVSANLWARTVRVAAPADWAAPPRALFSRTSDPLASHSQPAVVELTIERGVPVAINGIPMSFPELVEVVDTIAGDHGVGRTDRVHRTPSGFGREIGESPSGVTLALALAEIERAALDPGLFALKISRGSEYVSLANDGCWFSPSRKALDAFVDAAMTTVSGTVRLMLFRGACRVVGRQLADAAPAGVIAKEQSAAPPAH
jgi:argininosuccinate synthase